MGTFSPPPLEERCRSQPVPSHSSLRPRAPHFLQIYQFQFNFYKSLKIRFFNDLYSMTFQIQERVENLIDKLSPLWTAHVSPKTPYTNVYAVGVLQI